MKLGLLYSCLAVGAVAVGACGGDRRADEPGLEGPEVAENAADLTSGRVSIRVPLIDQEHKALSRHNPKLRAAGLATFPETVEIEGGANGLGLAGSEKNWAAAAKLTDDAFETLKLDVQMQMFGEPHDFKTDDPATTLCYKGNPKLVVKLIESLTDSVFSDQLNVHGWRFRQVKVMQEQLTPEDEETFPAIWKNWRGRGNAILMLTASSDDGSETNVAIVPKCD
jgi:hypothetical protein